MTGYILIIFGILMAAVGFSEGRAYGLFESLMMASIGIGLAIAGVTAVIQSKIHNHSSEPMKIGNSDNRDKV